MKIERKNVYVEVHGAKKQYCDCACRFMHQVKVNIDEEHTICGYYGKVLKITNKYFDRCQECKGDDLK